MTNIVRTLIAIWAVVTAPSVTSTNDAAWAQTLPAAQVLARGFPSSPSIEVDGKHVFIIWFDEGWWMRRSGDWGISFDPPVRLGLPLHGTGSHRTSTAGRLHLCWDNFVTPDRSEVFYANIDLHSGAASLPQRLSGANVSSSYCRVLASGSRVAVMWQDITASYMLTDMLVVYSEDRGNSFQKEIEIGWTVNGIPVVALSSTGDVLHSVWTTSDAQDKGLWYANIDLRARSVRKQRIVPDFRSYVLSVRERTVVIGSGSEVFVSEDNGGKFDKLTDIDPAPPAPFTRYPDGVIDRRIGLDAAAIHVDTSMIGVVASKGSYAELYFSASRDSDSTFSRAKNLSLVEFPYQQSLSMPPRILVVGSKLVVVWSEFDRSQNEQLSFCSSGDQGRTFGPVRRMSIHTRLYNSIGSPDVRASGDALLFAWTKPGDARKNQQGSLMLMRVTP